MKKSQVRELHTHYGYRCKLLKHNLQNKEQLITLYDRYILDNLNKGITLAIQSIGYQYYNLIPNLVFDNYDKVDNIIAANSTEFKYRTLDEIKTTIVRLSNSLNKQGRLFVSFNFQFVIFNRLTFDFNTECAKMLDDTGLKIYSKIIKKPEQTNPYGNNFFILQKDD